MTRGFVVLLLMTSLSAWGTAREVCADDGIQNPQSAAERSIWIPEADGTFRAVPWKDAKPDVEAGLRPAETLDGPRVVDYFLSQLKLDGTVSESNVDLTANVTLKVVEPDRWLKVPLRFDQGLLLNFQHQGDGEAAPDEAGGRATGINWLVRGAGEHRLRLTMRVPLRRTQEGYQFQLQLPPMGYFGGQLQLRIPTPGVTVPASQGDSLRVLGLKTEGASTIVAADLTGERLDLRWNVVQQRPETMVLEPTDIVLRLTEDVYELVAHQRIQWPSPQAAALRVRLPSGDFDLSPQGVRVSDRGGNNHWVQPTPTDDPNWVTIPVTGIEGDQIELDWRFSMPAPEGASDVLIDGFEIEDAPRHAGTIAVENRAGYRIVRDDQSDVGVKRIDVKEQSASTAYAFTGTQYRLKLRVEPVVPVLSVTPYYFVLVSQDRVELDAVFQINVDDGSFRSVPIQWQENKGTPWAVEASPFTPGELRAVPVISPDRTESLPVRRWALQLPDRVDRQAVIGMQAAYFFGFEGTQDGATFSLPTVVGARTFPGWIVVATADNVEITTRPRPGTMLTRQMSLDLSGRAIPVPDFVSTQPQTVYRMTTQDASTAPGLETDVTVRPQRTTTSSVIELARLERQYRITQRVEYQVSFGRVSRVRLQIPPQLAERIPETFRSKSLQFTLDGETRLEPEISGRMISLDLPSPRLGDFEIVVEHYLDHGDAAAEQEHIDVPVIRSLDQPYESVRLSALDQDAVATSVDDERWTRLTTVVEGLQWITDEAVDVIPVTLDRSLDRVPLRLTIREALLESEVDEGGTSETTATYVMQSPPPVLVVELPRDAQNPQFAWNNRPLAAADVREEPDLPLQFRLKRPATAEQEEGAEWRLTIRYAQAPRTSLWRHSQVIAFPRFPEGVWVERSWWMLELPTSQHLFLSPSQMSPQFQWERDQIFWKRRPNPEVEEVQREILGTHFLEPAAVGNVYPFRSLGMPTEVEFRTMSNSVIVLLGAGLTLTISFLLLKIPLVRHPLIWVVCSLAAMIASMWYLEPMLLLLQPAAYGLILPLCAVALEYASEGRHSFRRSRAASSQWDAYREYSSAYTPGSGSEPRLASTHIRPTGVSDSGFKP